jgi:FAD/FMN-containing dehydrogenase
MAGEHFLQLLSLIVGERYVLIDHADVSHFATDHRGRSHGEALAVVRPATTAEVAAVVCACADHSFTVTPQGGNTISAAAPPHYPVNPG